MKGCWKKEEAAYVLGDGPSLRDFDYSLLIGKNVIACNEAYFRLQEIGLNPSIWMFVDAKFVGQCKARRGINFYDLPFPIVAGQHCGLREKDNVRLFISAREPTMAEGNLYYREHTGAAAINMAIQTGAKNIYLLGIDLDYIGDLSHSRPGHRMDGSENRSSYQKQIKRYERFASFASNITNLSTISALQSFPKKSWQEHFGVSDAKPKSDI